MAFQTDGRAFARLQGPVYRDAFEPVVVEETRGGLVIPETAAIRPTNFDQPLSQLTEAPRGRPWLLTSSGIIGPQVNTIGFKRQWVEGVDESRSNSQGLYLRRGDDISSKQVAPTGWGGGPLPRNSNLMRASYTAAPAPMPREGQLTPHADFSATH